MLHGPIDFSTMLVKSRTPFPHEAGEFWDAHRIKSPPGSCVFDVLTPKPLLCLHRARQAGCNMRLARIAESGEMASEWALSSGMKTFAHSYQFGSKYWQGKGCVCGGGGAPVYISAFQWKYVSSGAAFSSQTTPSDCSAQQTVIQQQHKLTQKV